MRLDLIARRTYQRPSSFLKLVTPLKLILRRAKHIQSSLFIHRRCSFIVVHSSLSIVVKVHQSVSIANTVVNKSLSCHLCSPVSNIRVSRRTCFHNTMHWVNPSIIPAFFRIHSRLLSSSEWEERDGSKSSLLPHQSIPYRRIIAYRQSVANPYITPSIMDQGHRSGQGSSRLSPFEVSYRCLI